MDFSKLKDGEAILVKTFYGKKEYLYLDHNKVITPDTQGDPLYARYAIDWAKTKKESSPDAIAFFKDIESGRSITTSGTVRWNKNGFTGLTYGDIKSTAMTYMTDPEVSYNRWVQSETITVKEKKTKLTLFEFDMILRFSSNGGQYTGDLAQKGVKFDFEEYIEDFNRVFYTDPG